MYAAYAGLSDDPVRIAMCHWMFERVHPFSDGNGRVGRLVMFKECLRLDTVPPLVRDENRNMYVRGLDEFPGQPGWLVDTLLAERDSYLSSFIETLAPGAVRCSYADEWSEGASSGVLAEAADFERDVESLAGVPETARTGTRIRSPRTTAARVRRPAADDRADKHMRMCLSVFL